MYKEQIGYFTETIYDFLCFHLMVISEHACIVMCDKY